MLKPESGHLSGIDKVGIIQAISLGGDELKKQLSGFASNSLIEARKFITDIILDFFKDDEMHKLTRGGLQKLWMPIPDYFNAQGCLETLESCKAEDCYQRNPVCFSRKLTGQIGNLIVYFEENKKKDTKEAINSQE